MTLIDNLRLATRMFKTNRSRTMLTILGISVGIGAILFLVSLGYGLQNLILNKITTSDALLSLDVTAGETGVLQLNSDTIKDVQSIPGVDKISPMISTQAQMMVDDISSELVANFVDSEFFKLEGTTLKKGGSFYTDNKSDENSVIVSSAALKLFNVKEEDAYNKNIKFILYAQETTEVENKKVRDQKKLDQDFKIKGIIDDENSSYVYLPFSLSSIIEAKTYSKVKLKVDKKENLNQVRDSIQTKGFMVSALSDIIEQANQVFNVVQIVLASFGIVALIVSAIGMFNTMTIALLERTQEIGIMKALGAVSLDIWRMFLAESVIIGFLGGVGGIVIGWLIGEIANYALNLLAGAMGGEKIDLFYTPLWFIILIISFSSIVGLLTGFYPAKRAAAINCLEALRYK
jgi:putative ABC transport system permease protein